MAAALTLPRPGPRDPAPVTTATLSFSRSTLLERGVDLDVDEARAAAGERAAQRGGDVLRLLDALASHAQRAGEPEVVDGRGEVHADVDVVLGRVALQRV